MPASPHTSPPASPVTPRDTPRDTATPRPVIAFVAASLALLSLPGLASLALTAVDRFTPTPEAVYRDTTEKDPVVHERLQRAIATSIDTLRRDLFGVSHDDRVLIGSNQWLYLAQELTPFFNGSELFTPDRLAHTWVAAFAHLAATAKAHATPFVVVIAAEKQSVAPEFLPAFTAAPHPETRTTQLVAAIADHHRTHGPASLPFVDSRDLLRTIRRDREVYLRLDTHWNGSGALAVLDAALRKAGIDPARHARITATPPTPITQRGDLAAMIGLDAKEVAPSLITLLPPLAPNWHPNGPQSSRVALTSDGSIACACLHAASGDGTVVVFGDSFANTFWPALARAYRHVIHFDIDNLARFDEAFALNPELIIVELAERRLRGDVPAPTHASSPTRAPTPTPHESLASLVARAGCDHPIP